MADDAFTELLQRPKRTQQVMLAWDPDDAETLKIKRRVVKQLERAAERDNAPDTAQLDLTAGLAELAEFEDLIQTVVFEFEGIGTKKVDAIVGEHPPTVEQIKEHKKLGTKTMLQYNPETFMVALIAATCTVITTPSGNVIENVDESQIGALLATATFSQSDQVALFTAATMVDLAGSTVDDILKG